jgi:hypothetical protein
MVAPSGFVLFPGSQVDFCCIGGLLLADAESCACDLQPLAESLVGVGFVFGHGADHPHGSSRMPAM